MKIEIIENLKELHARQGISFLSVEDATAYYKELIELIEGLVEKYSGNRPTGSTISISQDEAMRIQKQIMRRIDILADGDARDFVLEKEQIGRLLDELTPIPTTPTS